MGRAYEAGKIDLSPRKGIAPTPFGRDRAAMEALAAVADAYPAEDEEEEEGIDPEDAAEIGEAIGQLADAETPIGRALRDFGRASAEFRSAIDDAFGPDTTDQEPQP